MGKGCECVGACHCVALPVKEIKKGEGEEGEEGAGEPEAKRRRREEQEEVLVAQEAVNGEWDWQPASFEDFEWEEFIPAAPMSPEL